MHEWGVPAEAGLAELERSLGRDAAADVAIVYRLGGMGSTDSVALLERIAETTKSKEVRDEVRRAFYRLEQRGVYVRPQQPAPKQPSLFANVESGPPRTFFLPFVNEGRLWILTREQLGKFLFALAETQGYDGRLVKVEGGILSRKGYRKFLNELSSGLLPPVEVDPVYCDFLLSRAYGNLRETEHTEENNYLALRAWFFDSPPPETMDPPVLRFYTEDNLGACDLDSVFAVEKLIKAVPLALVLLSDQELEPFVVQLVEAATSPLVLTPGQVAHRREQIFAAAVSGIFAAQRLPEWVYRLRESAYYAHVRGESDAARYLLAVAAALESGSRAPEDLAFCRVLVSDMLRIKELSWYESEATVTQERLVLTPAELARSQSRLRSASKFTGSEEE